MPVFLIYILAVGAIATVAGVGFSLGGGIASLFSTIGLVVVGYVLWEPLIKPMIEKIVKK